MCWRTPSLLAAERAVEDTLRLPGVADNERPRHEPRLTPDLDGAATPGPATPSIRDGRHRRCARLRIVASFGAIELARSTHVPEDNTA